MKVAINQDFGGFSLSGQAFELLLQRKGIAYETVTTTSFGYERVSMYRAGHAGDDDYYLSDYDFTGNRADPDLVAVIEELGDDSWGPCASLKIVEIPDDIEWYIEEYDGRETIHEKHLMWS